MLWRWAIPRQSLESEAPYPRTRNESPLSEKQVPFKFIEVDFFKGEDRTSKFKLSSPSVKCRTCFRQAGDQRRATGREGFAALIAPLEKTLDIYEVNFAKQKFIVGDQLSLADLFHVPFAALFPGFGSNAMLEAECRQIAVDEERVKKSDVGIWPYTNRTARPRAMEVSPFVPAVFNEPNMEDRKDVPPHQNLCRSALEARRAARGIWGPQVASRRFETWSTCLDVTPPRWNGEITASARAKMLAVEDNMTERKKGARDVSATIGLPGGSRVPLKMFELRYRHPPAVSQAIGEVDGLRVAFEQ
ncbi:hypothetical protein DFP72DRAFT_1044685 [Ephemerocybe angulata]|uniref:Glutathione S-transferase C-terminal domain-containing protein n=1 Tax=Ephemerocybe angulata TaxID=980116 RepID=A0A8H6M6U1_9AGAR|nr:hypothetical protein DFP72DRAFT_1044685 [Tulosesus angulatus]